jgi:hypothetical protein
MIWKTTAGQVRFLLSFTVLASTLAAPCAISSHGSLAPTEIGESPYQRYSGRFQNSPVLDFLFLTLLTHRKTSPIAIASCESSIAKGRVDEQAAGTALKGTSHRNACAGQI